MRGKGIRKPLGTGVARILPGTQAPGAGRWPRWHSCVRYANRRERRAPRENVRRDCHCRRLRSGWTQRRITTPSSLTRMARRLPSRYQRHSTRHQIIGAALTARLSRAARTPLAPCSESAPMWAAHVRGVTWGHVRSWTSVSRRHFAPRAHLPGFFVVFVGMSGVASPTTRS